MSDMFTTAAAPTPPATSAGSMTPDAARAAIAAFEDGPAWRGVLAGQDAGKVGLMAQRDALYRLAYPAEPATNDGTHRGPGWSVEAEVAAAMEASAGGASDPSLAAAAMAADTPMDPTAIGLKIGNTLHLPGVAPDLAAETRETLGAILTASRATEADAGVVVAELMAATRRPELYADEAEGMAVLERQHGVAGAAREVAHAKAALAHLERSFPDAREWLVRSGLGNSPAIIGMLARTARRLQLAR
jgi:hypothetical protein